MRVDTLGRFCYSFFLAVAIDWLELRSDFELALHQYIGCLRNATSHWVIAAYLPLKFKAVLLPTGRGER